MRFVAGLAACVLASGWAGWATAREPQLQSTPTDDAIPADWDLVHEGDAVMATVVFTPGLTLVVRCRNQTLEVLAAGLPRARRSIGTRVIDISRGAGRFSQRTWVIARDRTIAVDMFPAATARQMRLGGRFRMRTEGPDRKRYMYDMTLPSSDSAIDTVLTACGRPLEDPNDATMPDTPVTDTPAGMRWVRLPNPEPPRRFRSGRIEGVMAGVSCAVSDAGTVSDCRIESEYPSGTGFGASVLAAVPEARVEWIGEGRRPARLQFIVTIRMAS